MVGARINDGDIVYVRQQDEVENGEIAAVLVNDGSEAVSYTHLDVYKRQAHLVLEGWFIIVRLTLQIFVEAFICFYPAHLFSSLCRPIVLPIFDAGLLIGFEPAGLALFVLVPQLPGPHKHLGQQDEAANGGHAESQQNHVFHHFSFSSLLFLWGSLTGFTLPLYSHRGQT